MGLFESLAGLAVKTVTLPVTVAADVVTGGTTNMIREMVTGKETKTPIATVDHLASIVKSVEKVADDVDDL